MRDTNAREEFTEEVDGKAVICAGLTKNSRYGWDATAELDLILPLGYTPEQYESFLALLSFEYDSGYGGQELFGTIWYADGTWSSRGEYDGSEWWEYNMVPDIPDELKNASQTA